MNLPYKNSLESEYFYNKLTRKTGPEETNLRIDRVAFLLTQVMNRQKIFILSLKIIPKTLFLCHI